MVGVGDSSARCATRDTWVVYHAMSSSLSVAGLYRIVVCIASQVRFDRRSDSRFPIPTSVRLSGLDLDLDRSFSVLGLVCVEAMCSSSTAREEGVPMVILTGQYYGNNVGTALELHRADGSVREM